MEDHGSPVHNITMVPDLISDTNRWIDTPDIHVHRADSPRESETRSMSESMTVERFPITALKKVIRPGGIHG